MFSKIPPSRRVSRLSDREHEVSWRFVRYNRHCPCATYVVGSFPTFISCDIQFILPSLCRFYLLGGLLSRWVPILLHSPSYIYLDSSGVWFISFLQIPNKSHNHLRPPCWRRSLRCRMCNVLRIVLPILQRILLRVLR